jgi:hypothetical protein
MKFLDLLEDNTEKSIIKRGKLIYEHLRIGHILYSDTTYDNWDIPPLKIGYTLPEKYDVSVYKDAFPMITFYDEVEYDVPEGFYDENNLLMDEFGETEWIQDIQEKFWNKHRVVLVDDNFGEILDLRHYLRDI